jgi:L-alanine-DL-glutamate epimerase-like enolase superfamily enzyme
VTRAYIGVVNPQDVAREVERQSAVGFRSFVLRQVAGGGMLDQERLGAARYAAGLQADVRLEAPEDVPVAAAR